MLDGLNLVIGQILALTLIVAAIAFLLGWMLGRNRPRTQAAPPPEAAPQHVPVAAQETQPTPSEPEPEQSEPEPTESGSAEPEPAPDGDLTSLQEELAATKAKLDALEAGAIAAWDRTVPHFEDRIAALTEDNNKLTAALTETQAQLEVAAKELVHMRESRSPGKGR